MSDVDNFVRGTFRVDCSVIQLTRGGALPIDVGGPGHLSQDESGSLNYAIHLSPAAIGVLVNEINRPRQVGALIPPEEYIQLVAQAYNGPIWTATIAGSGITTGPGGGGLAFGLLHQIVKVFDRIASGEGTAARLLMRGSIEFPATEFSETQVVREGRQQTVNRTRDYAAFSTGGDNFVLLRREHSTELQCNFQGRGTDEFRHVRVQEALQFALGQVVEPCVIELSTTELTITTLRSVALRQSRGNRQEPPLSFRSSPMRREVFDIAARYYETILGHVVEDWHPLSSHVYYLIEAGGAAIELQALGISVAAEGIAGTCFPSLAQVEPAFRDELTAIQARLGELGISETLQRRLHGTLGAMASARNSDRIRSFVAENNFDQRLFQSWQAIRNTAAHGARLDGRDFAQTYSQLNDVLYLAYAMILHYCAYRGIRTDYSMQGHPDVNL